MPNDNKNSSKTMVVFFVLVFYVIFCFIVLHCVHVAHAGAYGVHKDIITVIEEGIDETFNAPFNLAGIGKYMGEAFKIIGISTIIIVVFVLYEYTNAEQKKHESEQTAKGSGKFTQNYRKFFKTYTKFNPVIDKKENFLVQFFRDTFGSNKW